MTGPILSAEQAYVGSLLWLPWPQAGPASRWLHRDDFASPWTALVHELASKLCDDQVHPDAAAVLALAVGEERVTGEHKIHTLTRVLWELIDHRVANPASIRWYAGQALEQTIRRRTLEMSRRLSQVVERADLDELERLNQAEQAALEQLRDRHRRLTFPAVVELAA